MLYVEEVIRIARHQFCDTRACYKVILLNAYIISFACLECTFILYQNLFRLTAIVVLSLCTYITILNLCVLFWQLEKEVVKQKQTTYAWSKPSYRASDVCYVVDQVAEDELGIRGQN